MATTTAIISGQSVGTGANKGEGLFAAKTTLQLATTGFVLTGRLTNGAAGYLQSKILRIWYSTSSFSITSAAAVKQLRKTARYLDLDSDPDAAGVIIKDSSFEPSTGEYLYIWCDAPTHTVAQTLDLNLRELP